jgi:hypothetical protein
MQSPSPPSLSRLHALLHEPAPAPAEAAAALAAERMALAAGDGLAHELLGLELRWLERQAEGVPELAAEVATARHDTWALRLRGLGAAPAEVAVLLDLAEVEAALRQAGATALAAEAAAAIGRLLPQLPRTTAGGQEVGERFALLSTAIDDLPIAHQVELLRCTGRVVAGLAAHLGGRELHRFARRLERAAGDRELERRLERRLGPRGVTALETTNFVLLLVVLGTLVLESTLEPTPFQLGCLQWIDALACTFFLADFVLELVLHPSRGSWFLRNALTDLVPAVPSVLFLVPMVELPVAAEGALLLRTLRLLRVTWAARYVQALRPLLRSARLLLFLVRGLDGLTARFSQLLNREFVFVPGAAEIRRPAVELDRRDLCFAALRREHELLLLLPAGARQQVVQQRLRQVAATAARLSPDGVGRKVVPASARDIPIDAAIEFLWALRPQDLGRWLRPADVQSLDRVVRVLSALPVRWLPLIRRVAVCPLPGTPEERIVQLGRRIAEWLESWHGRMLFFADLHGIVTGPQILDRVATAMVKATQRPAVRLVLFGGLFSLPRLFGASWGTTVSTSLLVLGAVCFVLLLLGHWLKRLAGQASETFRLTSEAHFLSQLEQVKRRYEAEDLAFLAARVFGQGAAAAQCERALAAQLASVRTGVPAAGAEASALVRLEANRTALLYLHYLDGAPLHESDVQTTEQLLASTSLDNLRRHFLHFDARARKRLRKLRLDDGTLFAGPYLWFRFITESIAVEVAKRIAGYNRFCIPLDERAAVAPVAMAAMQDWLQRRLDPRGGRTPKDRPAPTGMVGYPTTEFTALDFVGGDPERDRHLAALFGDEVLAVVQQDRRTMVREIFGTRPVHQLPKQERSFNPLRFYQRRLSHGRVLLAPLLLSWRFLRSVGWLVGRVRQIVREVLDPDLAMQRRQAGQAPFAVALRKIHRMKAPGLLEAIRLRLELDPVYSGAPAGWSSAAPFAAAPELERDLRFLQLRERQAVPMRDAAAEVRRQIEALHAALAWLPPLGAADGDPDVVAAGELAVGCAWIANQDAVRTLLFAERWRTEVLPRLPHEQEPLRPWQRAWLWCRGLFTVHPVDRWCQRHGHGLPPTEVAALRAAWWRDAAGTRPTLTAWLRLPAAASPAAAAVAILRAAWQHGPAVQRDLFALRAIQSLAVLDIRNYRDLVFQLGEYAADGDGHVVGSLP